jgi:hypothetical protein
MPARIRRESPSLSLYPSPRGPMSRCTLTLVPSRVSGLRISIGPLAGTYQFRGPRQREFDVFCFCCRNDVLTPVQDESTGVAASDFPVEQLEKLDGHIFSGKAIFEMSQVDCRICVSSNLWMFRRHREKEP